MENDWTRWMLGEFAPRCVDSQSVRATPCSNRKSTHVSTSTIPLQAKSLSNAVEQRLQSTSMPCERYGRPPGKRWKWAAVPLAPQRQKKVLKPDE
jgi:hypothetical protein